MRAHADTHVVMGQVHPLDISLWIRLIPIAFEVAREFKLPLKEISPAPNAKELHQQGVLGRCWPETGVIHVVLRFKDASGAWMPAARPEADVFKTLAHELAHLEERSHNPRFWALMNTLQDAITERRRV